MGTQRDKVNGGDASTDPRVEQIAADIDETRGDLTSTVREIGTRLEPASIAREAKDTVRGATIGKVEMMSIGAQETWRDVRTGNPGGIVDMVRENPVPAGMVGLGLALLFLNRGSRSGGPDGRRWNSRRWDGRRWDGGPYGYASARDYPGDYRWYESEAEGPSPVDRATARASAARDALGEKADELGDSVGQMASSVGDMASDFPERAGNLVDTGTWQARRMMDENPLGAGIIAVAAGAAIGMLLPTTSFERERVGPVRDQMVDQVADAADDAIDAAKSGARSTGASL